MLSKLSKLIFAAALAFSAAIAAAVPTSTATVNAATTPPLRINEVLAWNTAIPNAATRPDIIELHNAGAGAVDLSGKSLTDDPALPRKFVFPNGTSIPAGGYLVVYADDATSAPGLHSGFALDAEGDTVILLDSPGAGGGEIDRIVFGFQIPDFSVSRTGAGANVWALTAPTPAAANSAAVALAGPDRLRLNEWAGRVTFRLDHDMIELFNTAAQPVALGGVRMTDDAARPNRFVIPNLSFIGGNGFLPLYGADFVFTINGDLEVLTLFGENNEQIDRVTIQSQRPDRANGRVPDGAATIAELPTPTPGLPNQTPLPAGHAALLANLRITEIMYQPAAPSGSSDYEFIELQNIGATPLDLGGVRFTNGLDYEFPAGISLAPGAFIVVVNDRSSFNSRYPGLTPMMAPGGFNGSLDNTGETLALTLPAPWDVHILRFRFEPTWVASTAGGGHSLVPLNPYTTSPQDWRERATWRASAAVNGSPAAVDPGTPAPPPPPPTGGEPTARLANLSVRTALPANETLIVGFVVSGGPRDILVRAAGPALAEFGLGNAMTDPRLELYNGSTLVFENDNWPASLASTFTSVAAFPFAANSRDAALLQSIDGPRSIQARGTGAGVVLVEAYDPGTGNSPRLVNVSARNRVGTGDDILIAGFNIAGTGSKQLLIRAVGPRLATAPFGVPGVLTDPKLELYDAAGTKITENDNWSAGLASTFAAVAAFPLETNSRDAALLTTLGVGTYTVQVRGADGGTGEALIEIYEVP